MDLAFRVGDTDAATELVKQFHYSKRMSSNIQMVGTWHEPGGLFGDYGRAIAAVTYSVPPTRWSEDVWELSRLVRREDVNISLSQLMSLAVNFLRKSRSMDLIVSFADATQGHHGGIYQACSWNYNGRRGRAMDGVIFNGEFVPGRSAVSRWGTRSPDKLRLQGVTAEPHYDEGKHLYWKALSKEGFRKAKRLGLVEKSYPKPKLDAVG